MTSATVQAARACVRATGWPLIRYSPRGVGVVLRALGGWLTERPRAFFARLSCLGIAAAVVTVASIILAAIVVGIGMTGFGIAHSTSVLFPWWIFCFWITLLVLGRIGRPAQPVQPLEEAPALALTPEQDQLTKALCAAYPSKIGAAVKADPRALTVSETVTDWQTGARLTDLKLPYGVTSAQIIRQPELIAHALGTKTDQVSMTEGTHPGLVRISIAPVSPADRPPPVWALADANKFDLTSPLVIGEDMQGAPVSLRLFGTDERRRLSGGSLVIGGVSGSGKTSLLRLIVGAAALDPRAVIAVADLKGDHDFTTLDPALAWHRVSDTPENLADLKVMLTQAVDHMRAVAAGTADRIPVLIVIDECQRVTGKGGDKETAALIEDLIRRGRSSGIYMIVATQRPTSDSIPTSLRDNCRDHVCLRVANQASGAAVIDQLAYDPATDPSKISPDAIGTAVVSAAGYEGKARLAEVTSKMAGRAARRHRREHRLFGTNPEKHPSPDGADLPTSGEEPPVSRRQLPDDPPPKPRTIVEIAIDCWPEDRDRIACAELAWRLGIIDPQFDGWSAADVTRELKNHGIETRVIKIAGKSARGVTLDQLNRGVHDAL